MENACKMDPPKTCSKLFFAFKVIKLSKLELYYSFSFFSSHPQHHILNPPVSDHHCSRPLILSQASLLGKSCYFSLGHWFLFKFKSCVKFPFSLWSNLSFMSWYGLPFYWDNFFSQNYLIGYWLLWKHWSFVINWSHHVPHIGKFSSATQDQDFCYHNLKRCSMEPEPLSAPV